MALNYRNNDTQKKIYYYCFKSTAIIIQKRMTRSFINAMHFVGMDFKRWLHDFISFENSHHSKLARRILNMNLLISGS